VSQAWSVLNNINDAYASYTFNDISSLILSAASEKFTEFASKMLFKTLDINNDPATQEFVPHSYDIIIASNTLHVTKNLERTMHHVRSMLRPGGYLLVFETTGVQNLSKPFMFSGLPTWWPGQEADRQLRPIVSTLRWEEILNNTGFSGLDVVVHDLANEEKHTTALMISQAIDDQVLRLREPLNNIATAPAPVEGLTLIGGKKLATTKILSGIQKLLPRAWRSHMRTVNSIDAIEDLATIGPGSDIICLHDFDETLFASTMTESRLASLQGLLMKARNVLWITSARNGKSHAPRASMFHGIARIAPVEMPHLNLQTLGLEAGLAPTAAARHCVEAFIRLRETGEASSSDQGKETEGGKLLWAPEPEVEVLKNGEVIIPRVVPDQALNEIFLASKRTITKSVDATDVVVQAVPGTARMTLQTVYDKDVSTIDFTSVQVQYALHIPARKGNGIYLVLGTTATTSSPVMTASEINASVVSVPSERVVAIASEDCTPGMLVATANRVLIGGVTTLASPGKPVLLYGAEASLAAELATELSKRDIHAYFASLVLDVPDAWIKLHERSSKRAIQRAVPHDIALYVDCLSAQTPTGDNLRDCLPPGCTALQLDAQLLKKIFLGDQMVASALLRDAYLTAHKTTSSTELNCKIIEVPALANSPVASLASKRYVTDWQKRDYLSVTVPPLDTHGLFQPDRTYLMVGAAGGLGLSLCKWILAHGVKHLVITSRKPNVDPAVLEDAQRMGASVHVLPMDVTDRQSIEKVVQQIRNTMPPIAGVCQCAMVLQDRLFLDMSIKEMNGTLAAKVDGTENLDAVFADEALDFFVMLSSSATIIGNIGQANYHIGNLFMTSLAAQRRARGLAGSVIHVGHITDVGYIVKAKERTDQLAKHFASIRMMPLSETDVHHAFAQAVRGGRPGSQVSPDIIMGIEPASKPIDPESTEAIEDKIHWLANPRLSHMTPIISLHGDQQGPGQGGASAASSVRQRVEEAESEEEAVAGVVDAFCAKLDKTLQLPNGRAAENAQRAVIDLGIDSLVAVEIRNWFLRELGADVPVVKVLGGDSVIQICTTAARTVMARSMKEGEKKLKTNIDDNKTTAPVNPPAIVQANATPAHNGPLKSVSSNASTTNNQDELEDLTNASQDTPVSERTSIFKIDDNASSSSVSGEIAEEEAPDVRSKEESTLSKPEVIQEERMSRAQARIWFLSKHLSDPAAYNMVFHYRVNGPLNMMRLRHALQMTTHYHECLRMCFYQRVGDGNPMQGVMASSAYELEHLTEADNNDLQRTMTRFKTRVWDMETGRTMGVAVLSRGAETHDFIFGYHHIITDVVGWYFFLRDLDRAYRLQPLGKPCAISHLDYTRQELQQETAGIYNEQLEFWRAEFATLPDPLPLLPSASVRARPARQAQEQDRKKIQSEYRALSPEVVAAVKAASHQLRVSPFHFYLAVLQVFLAQQAGIEDVCVGLVDANRGDDERASCMVGCFVNVLPVQSRVAPRDSFAEVARTASRKALAAFAHAGVPFDVLLDALNAPRWADGDTPPLFQAAINYRAAGWGELPLGADCRLTLCLDDGKDAEPPYDISLGIMDMAEGCTIDLHCQGALYSAEATCKSMYYLAN
jgi:NAD(P)-dependent dehydrogenase (short-subunit alcohol dehydrogenase family)